MNKIISWVVYMAFLLWIVKDYGELQPEYYIDSGLIFNGIIFIGMACYGLYSLLERLDEWSDRRNG